MKTECNRKTESLSNQSVSHPEAPRFNAPEEICVSDLPAKTFPQLAFMVSSFPPCNNDCSHLCGKLCQLAPPFQACKIQKQPPPSCFTFQIYLQLLTMFCKFYQKLHFRYSSKSEWAPTTLWTIAPVNRTPSSEGLVSTSATAAFYA